MMMAGPTTVAAPRMDQPTGVPLYHAVPTRRPSLPHQPSSGSYGSFGSFGSLASSSSQQLHRRSSSATTASVSRHRRSSHYQHYQLQPQPQPIQAVQPQFLFYPQIVPYQQMPYPQQLPYQHQRVHNLLHSSAASSYQTLPYHYSYQPVNQPVNQLGPVHGYGQPSPKHHLRRQQHLLPDAPPSSLQHSSCPSLSSKQTLAALQTKQATSQAEAQVASTQTALFSGFSLRGSQQNKAADGATQKKQDQDKAQAKDTTKSKTVLHASAPTVKPPSRKKDSVGRNRGPVDAKDLTNRLYTILAECGMQAAANTTSAPPLSPLSPRSPLEAAPPQLLPQGVVGADRSGQRIRSRGSGNLRALYASNTPIVPTTGGGGGSIRRQPFSAPNDLNTLSELPPPPSMVDLQRRKHRTRSLSPNEVYMRGSGPAGTTGAKLPSPMAPGTFGQRRSVSSMIQPPPSAQHGLPYIPSQAAQQFARTTAAAGSPRKSTRVPKSRGQSPKAPYSHNQSVSVSPPLSPKSKPSPPLSPKTKPSPARSPRVQHAFKDTLAEPGSRRQSQKEGAEAAAAVEDAPGDADEKAEEAAVDGAAVEGAAADEATENADDEAEAEAEGGTDANAKMAKAAATKAMAAADVRRIVQEHSVDWTQSDEATVLRKQAKKEKKEREKREKKAKQQQQQQQQQQQAGDEARPLWRLKARLSSFSKDKLMPSPPATAVAVAEDKEDKAAPTLAATVVEEASKVQEQVLTAGGTKEVPGVVESAAGEPTSKSSSVLSLTALTKSSSFLSRFKF
ncbi:uncharacterized protein SPSK_01494 [Sporothrix schenckii 1099-18]|uniref:Uncharacterized protein n=1 Tax=Sporothrix schenckii 1099-18 TaxID=1397361 RepID=A0A0F2MDV9_SPOSC|nr:uncharacterized protein SPSK_01494 [Sporothrix schenckii 1099-18]KJR87015.1 hypothetical protein SPSK_01494 [Sporothrix schenckii 1099-18]